MDAEKVKKFTAQRQKSSASPKTAVNMLQSIYLLWLTHQHVDYNRLCINIQSVAKEKSCICRIPIYTVNSKKTNVAWPISWINHPVLCSKACSLWGVSIGMRQTPCKICCLQGDSSDNVLMMPQCNDNALDDNNDEGMWPLQQDTRSS